MSKKSFVFGTATITMALFSGLFTGCQLQSDQTVKTSLDVNNASVANLSALAPESRGDVDGDGSINAVDASLILIAASCIGSGEEPGLTAEQAFAADYNEDDIINAVDASLVLIYAANAGAGQLDTPTTAEKPKYAAFLQSLPCIDTETALESFTISESGITGAPQGLAEAVTYDFDRDGEDELVTFSFENNPAGKPDVAAKLYTWQDGKTVLLDTLYLTEFLDLTETDRLLDNTVFFSNPMSMQLVSVEDRNTMYFGALLNSENYIYQCAYAKGFGMFTVENGKFMEKMVGSSENFCSTHDLSSDKGVVAAKLLPPSLQGTLTVTDCYVDEALLNQVTGGSETVRAYADECCSTVNGAVSGQNRFLLCADVDHGGDCPSYLRGGEYSSVSDAYAALFQDFSLRLTAEEQRCPGVLLAPTKNAEMKTLVSVSCVDNDDPYSHYEKTIACGKNLTRLLNLNDRDLGGADLFADILQNPDSYPLVWKTFEYDGNYQSSLSYKISDLDSNGQEELLLVYLNNDYDRPCADTLVIVDSDGTVIGSHCTTFDMALDDQGLLTCGYSAGHCMYFDVKEMDCLEYYGSIDGVYFCNLTKGVTYYDSNAEAILNGLDGTEVDNNLIDSLLPYQWGSSSDIKPGSTEQSAEPAVSKHSNWKQAYQQLVEEDHSTHPDSDREYALIDLIEDYPALVIYDTEYMNLECYMYLETDNAFASWNQEYYVEMNEYCPGSGEFLWSYLTEDGETRYLVQYQDGKFTDLYEIRYDYNPGYQTDSYFINEKKVTVAEYNAVRNKYTETPVFQSYSAILSKLTSDADTPSSSSTGSEPWNVTIHQPQTEFYIDAFPVYSSGNAINGGLAAGYSETFTHRGDDGYLYSYKDLILSHEVVYLVQDNLTLYFYDKTAGAIAACYTDGSDYRILYNGDARELCLGRDGLYFSNSSGVFCLHENGSVTKLYSGNVWYLNVGEQIYFTDIDKNRTCFRCELDGSGLTTILDGSVYDVLLASPDVLYYCLGKERALYRMNLRTNTSESMNVTEARWLNADSAHLFYTHSKEGGIYYMDVNGDYTEHTYFTAAQAPEVLGILIVDQVLLWSDSDYHLHSIRFADIAEFP